MVVRDEKVTVAVTGANGMVGRFLLKRLEGTPMETVAIVRNPVELPGKKIIVAPFGSSVSTEALKRADVVVHLAGTLYPIQKNSYDEANVATARAVAEAVRDGDPKRVLFLSYVGASEASKNRYLQTKGTAERLLKETGKDVIIFRATHIIGPPESPGPFATSMIAKPGKKASVLGSGKQMIAPLFLGDVVSALLAALKGGAPGAYELAGPDRFSLDDLVRLLNRDSEVPISHLPNWAARFFGLILPMLPGPFVDVILRDSVGDPSQAIATFGLKLTSMKKAWGR